MFSDVEIQAKRVLESRTPEVQAQFDAEARAAYKAWFHNGGDGDEVDSKLYWAWLDADARRSGRERAFRTGENEGKGNASEIKVEISVKDLVSLAVKSNLPNWWEDELLGEEDVAFVSQLALATLIRANVYPEAKRNDWRIEALKDTIRKAILHEARAYAESPEQAKADAAEAKRLNEALAGENAQARREGRGTVRFVTQQERDEEAKLSGDDASDVLRERGQEGA